MAAARSVGVCSARGLSRCTAIERLESREHHLQARRHKRRAQCTGSRKFAGQGGVLRQGMHLQALCHQARGAFVMEGY